jgi:organic hydroperoxide reductase OsmC/OhrA
VSTESAKRFEYAAGIDRAGRISAEGGPPLTLGDEWSPEALVLAGLARCVLKSLRYHARREGRDVAGSAGASGTVTRRESDGRYAFVDAHAELEVDVDPPPVGDELAALLAKAERDCFVSASLTAATTFSWRVNGEEATT